MSALAAEFGAGLQRGSTLRACSRDERRPALLAETRPRSIQHPAAWAADASIISSRRHVAIAATMGTVVTVMMPPIMAAVMTTTMMATTMMTTKYSVQETHTHFSIYCLIPRSMGLANFACPKGQLVISAATSIRC